MNCDEMRSVEERHMTSREIVAVKHRWPGSNL